MSEAVGRYKNIMKKILERVSKESFIGYDYLAVCSITMQLLEDTLEEDYDFPIDIYTVAEQLKIEVSHRSLNELIDPRIYKMVGWTHMKPAFYEGQNNKGIVIDNRADVYEQRYALAHEILHYIVHAEDDIYNGIYHIMPMLFSNYEEMIADIFALFLLIPVPKFLKEFRDYTWDCHVPIQTSEWLEHLSWVSETPYEDVTIGYQNMRYVCCLLYKFRYGDENLEHNEQYNTYISSFGEETGKEIKEIMDKQIQKMLDCFDEDIKETLFC